MVAGSHNFYGNTKQIQYFDSALNDSDLEKLTSWVSFSDMANGQLYTHRIDMAKLINSVKLINSELGQQRKVLH